MAHRGVVDEINLSVEGGGPADSDEDRSALRKFRRANTGGEDIACWQLHLLLTGHY